MNTYTLALSHLAVLSLASAIWCPAAQGQWAVGVRIGADRYWGGSVETAPERRSFRPYRPTTVGVGFQRRADRLGLGLRLQYSEASLALEGEEAVVAVKGVFSIYSVSPELVYRISRLGSENELLLHAGPLVEVWDIIDEDSKVRFGGQGAVSLRVPLGGRFAGSLAAGAALTSSPFTRDQLEQEFEPRALWRRTVTAGLEYRL
jgi:hypothetical protein